MTTIAGEITESIAVYFQHLSLLFENGQSVKLISVHDAVASGTRKAWFASPIGEKCPEIELIYTKALVKCRHVARATERAQKFLERIFTKEGIAGVTLSQSLFLPPTVTPSARAALSSLFLLLAEQTDEKLIYHLCAVRVDESNQTGWNQLLSQPLMTETEKKNIVSSIRDPSLRNRAERWLVSSDHAVTAVVSPGIVPDITAVKQQLRREMLFSDHSASASDTVAAVCKSPLALHDIELAPSIAVALYSRNEKTTLFELTNFLLSNHEDSPDAFFVAGIYYLSCNRFDVARKFFSRGTGSCHGWIGYGLSFSFSDESGHAISALRTAARLYPRNVLPLLYMGMEYIRTNDLKLAQSYLVSALALCDEDSLNETLYRSLVLNEIGIICLKAEQFDLAMENLRLCIGSHSSHVSLFYSNLGYSLVKLRDIEAATKAFGTAVALNRKNGQAIAGLGYCMHCKGSMSKAIEYYSQSLGLVSTNRKIENLIINLIQIAVNEYSFSVKLNVKSVEDESDMMISAC